MRDLSDDSPTTAARWPALVTRTSGELLGRRPLPRVLAERRILFVLGPGGVGKTTVARRLLGGAQVEVPPDALRRALTYAARYARWPDEMAGSPALLLDGVDFFHGRHGALELLAGCLARRAASGHRTVLVQGVDASMTLLFPHLLPEVRASVLLRFPVGRGRRRYVVQRCRARGIEFARARAAVDLADWSYRAVEEHLDRVG